MVCTASGEIMMMSGGGLLWLLCCYQRLTPSSALVSPHPLPSGRATLNFHYSGVENDEPAVSRLWGRSTAAVTDGVARAKIPHCDSNRFVSQPVFKRSDGSRAGVWCVGGVAVP